VARLAGWRISKSNEECFVMDKYDVEDSFATFNIGRRQTLLSIFLIFVTEELLQFMLESFSEDELRFSRRKRSSHFSVMIPTIKIMYLLLAMHIRIIGEQIISTENDVQVNPLRKRLLEVSAYFLAKFGIKPPGIDVCSRLTAIMTFGIATEELISRNFYSVLIKLGQYVAGDEKLFHFTGKSGQVRLVPSKPDKIGLWFYELCTPLKCGKPYLLRFRLHHNENGPIKVSDVVKQWTEVIMKTGVEHGVKCYEKCFLVMDSYYMDAESRRHLLEMKIKFSSSCCSSRFGPEVRLVHGETADVIGQHSTIYNETTQELFTYHFDTQKGVGKKYNLSWDLMLNKDKLQIRAMSAHIPGYDVYKSMFECCDRFNRNLHDKTWPHRRGGNVQHGHFGRASDFILGCILQNTFALYDELLLNNSEVLSFKQKCINLSDEIYDHFSKL
jgi:hypothetical protein